MPSVATVIPSTGTPGNFPVQEIYQNGYDTGEGIINTVQDGFNPSKTETFTLLGNIADRDRVVINDIQYVFVNHNTSGITPLQSFKVERTADSDGSDPNLTQPKLQHTDEVVEGMIEGGRISLVTLDPNFDVIGARNLIEVVRVADTSSTNALRKLPRITGGPPLPFGIGLVFGEYALNPETGHYEFSHVENGSPTLFDDDGDPNTAPVNILEVDSGTEGLTWGELLDPTDGVGDGTNGEFSRSLNFSVFGQMQLVKDGFRRRNGNVTPYLMAGEATDKGMAYFHITNGTTVSIPGLGSFNYSQIYSPRQYREVKAGSLGGTTVLLATERSPDAEVYLYVSPQVIGNAGGFADLEESLYVLKIQDDITLGETIAAEWVRVNGNPVNNIKDLTDLDQDGNTNELTPVAATPQGVGINTLNAEALADWALDNATQFINLTNIVEDPVTPGLFYFVSQGESSYGELYRITLDPQNTIPTLKNEAESLTIPTEITLLVQGTAEQSFHRVRIDPEGQVILQGDDIGCPSSRSWLSHRTTADHCDYRPPHPTAPVD